MATLTIGDKQAREIYPSASAEIKTILENSFGGKEFFSQKITDRVKTFEDACNVVGVDVDKFLSYHSDGSSDEWAYRKLKIIAKALNEGWIPDWNNSNQYKWYPWFYMNTPGFRLDYVSYCTYSFVGSRLCFKSEELAKYAAEQFLSVYKDYFTS